MPGVPGLRGVPGNSELPGPSAERWEHHPAPPGEGDEPLPPGTALEIAVIAPTALIDLGQALHTSADCNQVMPGKRSEASDPERCKMIPKAIKQGEMLSSHTQNCIIEITFPSSPLLLLQMWHRFVKPGQTIQGCEPGLSPGMAISHLHWAGETL